MDFRAIRRTVSVSYTHLDVYKRQMVNPDAEDHLSFQTTQADKSHGAYQEMAEVQKYAGTVRKQMQEGLTDTCLLYTSYNWAQWFGKDDNHQSSYENV